MDAQDAGSNLLFYIVGFGILVAIVVRSERSEPDLNHIPTNNHHGYLRSYIDALVFAFSGPTILRRAYETYQPGVFKVATLHRWLVVVTSTQHIEELRKFSEEELSVISAANEADFSLYHSGHEHLIGSSDAEDFTRHLTQSLQFLFPEMREKVLGSLKSQLLNPSGSVWTEVDLFDLLLDAVTVLNLRVCLDEPSAFNEDLRSLGVSVANHSISSRYSVPLNLHPGFRTSVLLYFSPSHWMTQQWHRLFATIAKSSLGPLDLPNRANSPINLDTGRYTKYSDIVQDASESIVTNLAHVFRHLCSSPKYALPLRKEIELCVSHEGWTKTALDKAHKLDSFVKESLRLSPVNSFSSVRRVLIDITLSDGTCLPKGTIVCVPSLARHLDQDVYGSTSSLFDGFRFSKLQEQYCQTCESDSEVGSRSPLPRYQVATSSSSFLTWGYGRHTCPGRFYASTVMKLVIATILVEYDIKFGDGVRPKDVVCNGARTMPQRNTKVLIRKR